jgi:hypothetical protein
MSDSPRLALADYCRQEKQVSLDRWHLPQLLEPHDSGGSVTVKLGDDGAFLLNDWSFSQLCRLAGISKDTVNRLSPTTASRGTKPNPSPSTPPGSSYLTEPPGAETYQSPSFLPNKLQLPARHPGNGGRLAARGCLPIASDNARQRTLSRAMS